MKIRGLKTEYIDIEVNAGDVVAQLMDAWLSKQPAGGTTITAGKWYAEASNPSNSWTECLGDATPQEVEVWEAFTTLLEVVGNTNR